MSEFIGKVAEVMVQIGDTKDGPAVAIQGFRGDNIVSEKLEPWECEVLILRALSVLAQVRGQSEGAKPKLVVPA